MAEIYSIMEKKCAVPSWFMFAPASLPSRCTSDVVTRRVGRPACVMPHNERIVGALCVSECAETRCSNLMSESQADHDGVLSIASTYTAITSASSLLKIPSLQTQRLTSCNHSCSSNSTDAVAFVHVGDSCMSSFEVVFSSHCGGRADITRIRLFNAASIEFAYAFPKIESRAW